MTFGYRERPSRLSSFSATSSAFSASTAEIRFSKSARLDLSDDEDNQLKCSVNGVHTPLLSAALEFVHTGLAPEIVALFLLASGQNNLGQPATTCQVLATAASSKVAIWVALHTSVWGTIFMVWPSSVGTCQKSLGAQDDSAASMSQHE